MPIYTYECKKCSKEIDHIFSVNEKPETIECPICNGIAKSIFSHLANRKEWAAYVDDNLGDNPVLVESREHRAGLMKKAGLRDQYHHKPGMPGQWV